MFYISSKNNDKYGITDTSDGVEEFYSSRKIYDLMKNNKLLIYGASCWNNDAECDILILGKKFDSNILKSRIDTCRKLNNPWNEKPILNYLVELSAGTKFIISATDYTPETHRPFTVKSMFIKKDVDSWFFDSDEHVGGNQYYNNDRVSSILIGCTVYMNKYQILV